MKTFAKLILFAAIISMAWSWGSIFGRFKDIKEKKDNIKDSLNLEKLGLSSLKELSLKDIASMENLDLDSNLEKVKNLIPKKSDNTPHSDFEAFWTGMFNFFGLDKPTEIVECHGKISGNLFFRKLRKINDILQNSKSGNNIRLHSDYVQLKMIVSALDRACKCSAETKEYQRLGDKLDISSDPEAFMNAAYFYYEAKYHELAEPFEAIISEIDSGNFEKAGKMFGQLLKKSVNDYKKTGEDLLAYQAFHNGISSVLNIPPPTESVKCHDSRTAKLFTEFIKGASDAVTEGSWYRAEESFTKFWKEKGEELLNKLPAKVVKCERSSPDTKAFTEKVGTDPFSDEFTELMFDYLSHHSVMYYGYMRSIKKSIDNGDYLHAGVTHGHLIQSATKK